MAKNIAMKSFIVQAPGATEISINIMAQLNVVVLSGIMPIVVAPK